MSNGILVFIEHKGGVANKSSLEAIAAAQKLGSELQQAVSAVVLGSDVGNLAQEIASYEVAKVICGTNPKLASSKQIRNLCS
jgi:electron transfer flavoprotein alpha subunit